MVAQTGDQPVKSSDMGVPSQGWFVELGGQEAMELAPDGIGHGGEAGVAHVVVGDEDAEGAAEHQVAAVREELDKTDGAEENIEAALLNAIAVTAARHVAHDSEEVEAPAGVACGLANWVKVGARGGMWAKR